MAHRHNMSPNIVPSNESRLSCGAKLKHSQMEFYHTARRTFAGLIEEGRRQLQAHVRLRTTSHSLGPSFHRAARSTRRNRPLTAIVMPNGPMLGTRQPHRPRTPRDFQWIALSGSNRTGPTDADFGIGTVHVGVHNRIGL